MFFFVCFFVVFYFLLFFFFLFIYLFFFFFFFHVMAFFFSCEGSYLELTDLGLIRVLKVEVILTGQQLYTVLKVKYLKM